MTRRSFSTDFKLEAAGLVLDYLTDYYNHQRPHSYNGYRTPAETESLAG
ncbi:integrase core domain-containing protein [Pseudomonas sp. 8BK]